MPPDFSTRDIREEIMDDLSISGQTLDRTLFELDMVNHWLGGNQVTINGLEQLCAAREISDKLRIVDVGCGSGKMLALMNDWAVKKGIQTELTGIDANPAVINYAKNQHSGETIAFKAIDIFSNEIEDLSCDIITASLFTHHFSANQLVELFTQWQGLANIGVVINDLHRHPLAYYSIKLITRFFSSSAMVKSDGPLSVLRAFRKNEIHQMMEQAGINNYSLSWHWAFRWQLIIPSC